jgi:hypothetical protein
MMPSSVAEEPLIHATCKERGKNLPIYFEEIEHNGVLYPGIFKLCDSYDLPERFGSGFRYNLWIN